MPKPGLRIAFAFLVVIVGLMRLAAGENDRRAVKVPKIDGPYITVYRPQRDRFPGPDTPQLKTGDWYDDWVPNDHAFVKGRDNRWHAFGITHPLTGTDAVHEGEFQSFHAVAPKGLLRDVLRDGVWKDLPKVLPAAERPGEILANHAPYIVEKDGLYQMIYGPSPIRLATSTDLRTWTPKGSLFHEPSGARDPSVWLWQGTYYMVFCTKDSVNARTSKDLLHWTESRTVVRMKNNVAPESPSVVRFDGTFYLFVCGWNGIWDRKTVQGAYQHVTYVYQSDDPLVYDVDREVTRLQSHAPEVFRGEDSRWYVSSAEWPQRGISIAPLIWK